MVAVLAPLLAVGGLALYLGVSFRWPYYRRIPVEFLAISAIGAGLGVVALARSPSAAHAVAAILSAAAFAFACWYVFSYSMFGQREDRPSVGERFPPFELPDSRGGLFRLADARGCNLLLLFYRGDW